MSLDFHYSAIERRVNIVDNPKYAKLVVPNGNQEAPVHRWFHLKEAFSSMLFEHVLRETGLAGRRDLRVLDPFAGVGTTAVSVAESVLLGDVTAAVTYGVETNGFLQLVASSKLRALQQPSASFGALSAQVVARALRLRDAAPVSPALSTFQRRDYFDREVVDQLLRLKQAVHDVEADGAEALDVALARVCIGAIVESVSNLRRDGRALRYTEKRSRPAPLEAFRVKAAQITDDMPHSSIPVAGRIVRGDGCSLESIDGHVAAFDLILFSPPYPNNIDYTEVYKLENWLLDFIGSNAEFTDQRLRTVYSHPSILREAVFPDPRLTRLEEAAISALIEPVLAAVPEDRYRQGRRRVICGYARDMYLALRNARDLLTEGGKLVYVVGNSVHGRGLGQFIIAADLLIARLGEIAGLRVDSLIVARHLRRRSVTSEFLRESVVFLSR
jgi:hypothetical protein